MTTKGRLSLNIGIISKEKPENGQAKMYCKSCSKKYDIETSLTNLKYHYDKEHKKNEGQKKIQDVFRSDFKAEECNLLLIKWICDSLQPFSIVEENPFQDFITYLNPKYKLPCRNTLKSKINHEYEERKCTIHDILSQSASKISLTSDGWSSPDSVSTYISTTAHFFD